MEESLEGELKLYSPSEKIKNILKDVIFLMLVGPSGSGKDTVVKQLVLRGSKFSPIITYTTRAPRLNHGIMEVDGREYHFINQHQAKQMLKQQAFIEVANNHGNLYGTGLDEFIRVNSIGKIGVSDIDVKGVAAYKSLSKKSIAIFLIPPSFEVMLKRLAKRYGHSHNDEDIKVRLRTALFELKELLSKDYFSAVINDDLDLTVATVESIVSTNAYDTNKQQEAIDKAQRLILEIENYLK
jgi:guanylate kinase